jgi:hypothetical protein
MTTKAQSTKIKINKLDFIKVESFCESTDIKKNN